MAEGLGLHALSSEASSLQIKPSLLFSFTKCPSMKVSIVTNSLPIDEKKTLLYVKVLPNSSTGASASIDCAKFRARAFS